MLRQVYTIKFHHAVEQERLVTQHAEAWTDSVWRLHYASNKIMFWFTAFVHTVDFLHRIHFLNCNRIHVPTLANGTTSKVSYCIIFVVGISEQDGPAGVTVQEVRPLNMRETFPPKVMPSFQISCTSVTCCVSCQKGFLFFFNLTYFHFEC